MNKNNINILFVDDEEVLLEVVGFFLQNRGYKVLLANSGKTALDYIHQKKKIDIMFLDLMMPGLDGFDVLTDLQNNKIDIPVIVQSGILANDDVQKTKKLGACDFISKPYNMQDIEDLINKYL
jgi:CheY-like chemotaxis protein